MHACKSHRLIDQLKLSSEVTSCQTDHVVRYLSTVMSHRHYRLFPSLKRPPTEAPIPELS